MMVTNIRRLPILTAASDSTRTSRTRKTSRHAVSTRAVVCASSSGESVAVRLNDISTHGCCLQSEPASLRPGNFVSLRLNNARPVQGVVRWMRDGATGIEFLRPLTGEDREWLARVLDDDDW